MSQTYISLKGNDLRWHADVASLHGLVGANEEGQDKETACLPECTLGQDRGIAAFRFGMAMKRRGYNIFVTGPSVTSGGLGGVARIDTLGIVKSLLRHGVEQGQKKGNKIFIPDDLCYVYNFAKPDEPTLLRFQAGMAKKFKKDVHRFVEGILRELPLLFENQEYMTRKNQILEEHERKNRDLFKKLEGQVRDSGFAIINMQMGSVKRPDIAPLIDGEPVAMLKLAESQEKGEFLQVELESLKATYATLKDIIDTTFLEVRRVQRDMKRKIVEMDSALFQQSAREFAQEFFAYSDEKVQTFIDGMLRNMGEKLEQLRQMTEASGPAEKGEKDGQPHTQIAAAPSAVLNSNGLLSAYYVNILVDNSNLTGPPVIFESYPTYTNLFGTIERIMEQSAGQKTKQSDYRKIHAGSFVKANGGYLVLNLMDAITEVGVWPALKRVLKNEAMEIQTFDPYYFILTPNIKPEPIEMHVKVIVLATPELYHLLRHSDDDVARVFKVWADFDACTQRDDAALQRISCCMQGIVYEAGLLSFAPSAVASLLELGVRFAGRREKISIAFPQLRDIMEEANYIALLRRPKIDEGGENAEAIEVTASDVEAAMQARRYRAGQVEEKMQEMIARESILIDTKGLVVGQVNGLAVLSMGHLLVGKPTRITATTSIGKSGIVNIEREAELSGALHTKGMLILTGYLNRMFGQKRPLVLSASIAFEQSYGGVDGDSASSTEIYAILSSLSGIPIKQGIAVTGSVNQMGEVQAIGGVNEKIEGFFDCCVQGGLTGEQGVVIPYANVQDLMLDRRVIEAVDHGKFQVWAVKNISEGIEILTGCPSGLSKDPLSSYAVGSIFAKVDARLEEMSHSLRDYTNEGYVMG